MSGIRPLPLSRTYETSNFLMPEGRISLQPAVTAAASLWRQAFVHLLYPEPTRQQLSDARGRGRVVALQLVLSGPVTLEEDAISTVLHLPLSHLHVVHGLI